MSSCPHCNKQVKYIRFWSNARNVHRNYFRFGWLRLFTCEHCNKNFRATVPTLLFLWGGILVVVIVALMYFPELNNNRLAAVGIILPFVVILHLIWWKFLAKFVAAE